MFPTKSLPVHFFLLLLTFRQLYYSLIITRVMGNNPSSSSSRLSLNEKATTSCTVKRDHPDPYAPITFIPPVKYPRKLEDLPPKPVSTPGYVGELNSLGQKTG